MRTQDIDERRILGAAFLLLGLSLAGAAATAALMAFEHMAWAAEMCGPVTGHCVRCVAAGTFLVAALATSGAGLRLLLPSPAPSLAA